MRTLWSRAQFRRFLSYKFPKAPYRSDILTSRLECNPQRSALGSRRREHAETATENVNIARDADQSSIMTITIRSKAPKIREGSVREHILDDIAITKNISRALRAALGNARTRNHPVRKRPIAKTVLSCEASRESTISTTTRTKKERHAAP